MQHIELRSRPCPPTWALPACRRGPASVQPKPVGLDGAEENEWDEWDEDVVLDPDEADPWDDFDLGYEDHEPEPDPDDFWTDSDEDDDN